MKWQTVTSTIGYSVHVLWNNGRKLATLVFNPSLHTARIESADEKRVFQIRKEGFLKNKTVLRNEYGIRIGHTGSEKNEDFIILDNERFFYSPANENQSAVAIYKRSKDEPIAVCEMEVEQQTGSPALAGNQKSLQEDTRSSLLMMLCWYLFQPAKTLQTADTYLAPEYSLG